MKPPRVSVCVPTYNYGRFVGTAIDSVLAQEFQDFELIVVDNASEDDTAQRLDAYDHPRLRVYRNPTNIGLFGNFSRCLELAEAPLVKFLAADDWLHPSYLGEAVALMTRHPSAVIVSGPGMFVRDDGSVYGLGTVGVFDDELVPGAAALRAQARFLNVIGMPSNALLRRDAIDAVGGFDGRFAPAADVHLWGKLLTRGDLAWLRRPLSYLRIHSDKAHTYGLDPSDSTFRAWRDLAERAPTTIPNEVVSAALVAEGQRSVLHAAARVLTGHPARARDILALTSPYVRWPEVARHMAVHMPALVRGQAARIVALRLQRLVVYGPQPRIGPPIDGRDGEPNAT